MARSDSFSIHRDDSGVARVDLYGYLDARNAPHVKSACKRAISEGTRILRFDLAEVRNLDSAGLGVLVALKHWLDHVGDGDGEIVLLHPSPSARRPLEMSKVGEYFTVIEKENRGDSENRENWGNEDERRRPQR